MHPGDRPADNVKMAGICRSRTPELTGAFSTPGCIEAATINARLHTSAGASRMLSAQCTCNDPSRGFVTVYVRIMPAAHVSNLLLLGAQDRETTACCKHQCHASRVSSASSGRKERDCSGLRDARHIGVADARLHVACAGSRAGMYCLYAIVPV